MEKLPVDPMAALGEFLSAADKVAAQVSQAASLSANEDEKALLAGLLHEIKSQRAALESSLPEVFRAAGDRIDRSLKKLEKLQTKKGEVLAKAESLSARIDNEIALTRETRLKAPEPGKPPVPRPKFRKPAKPAPLNFSSGELLRNWLVPAEAPKLPTTPHTHGNIWENWKAVTRPQDPPDGDEEED